MDKVTYTVQSYLHGTTNHRVEARAIARAKRLERQDDPSVKVYMEVKSGTYSSSTVIYPTLGDTYSRWFLTGASGQVLMYTMVYPGIPQGIHEE